MPEKKKTKSKKASPKPKFNNRDFFTLPHPAWMIIITFSLYLLAMATIAPTKIPEYLGPFATLGVYVGKNYPKFCILASVFAAVAHSLEAAFAGKVCHDREFSTGATVKWTLSTFCFGFSSLIRLMPIKPPYKIV